MTYLLKTGGSSIVLGEGHFGSFFPKKENKLLKVTKINQFNNEFNVMEIVRSINDYTNYFVIPDKEIKTLYPSDNFYKYIKKLVAKEDIDIFGGELLYFYVDYAGEIDLFDSIEHLRIGYDFTIWKSYKCIFRFAIKMLDAINFLHQKKICHLDIKPENIVLNRKTKQFKIIDFGFASIEPFDDYINNIRGTPGYFPQNILGDRVTEYLPKIFANDRIKVNGKYPMQIDRNLVYKVDSYCLGRTLYFLKYVYQDNKVYECFNSEKKTMKKLDNLIGDLTNNDVYQRFTIRRCLIKYYS